MLIDSLDFIPKKLQNNSVLSKIAELLNYLISVETDNLNEILKAYNDVYYKYKDITQLSEDMLKELLSELGFNYILDLFTLTKVELIAFLKYLNLIAALKGTTNGVKLVLQLLNFNFTYELWYEQTPIGRPFTATVRITTTDYDSVLLSKLNKFFRQYTLPLVIIVITEAAEIATMHTYVNGPIYGKIYDSRQINIICTV